MSLWSDSNKLLYHVINNERQMAIDFRAQNDIDVNAPYFRATLKDPPMPLLHAYLHCTVNRLFIHSRMILLKDLGGVDANKVIFIGGKRYTPLLIAVEKNRDFIDICTDLFDILHADKNEPETLIHCIEIIVKRDGPSSLRRFLKKCDTSRIQKNEGSLLYCPFREQHCSFSVWCIPYTLQILIERCHQDPFLIPTDQELPILHIAIEFCFNYPGRQKTAFFAEIIQRLVDGGANSLSCRSTKNDEMIQSALEFYQTLKGSNGDDEITRILMEGEIASIARLNDQRKIGFLMGGHSRLGPMSLVHMLDKELLRMIITDVGDQPVASSIRDLRQARFDEALLKFAKITPDQLLAHGKGERDRYAKGSDPKDLTERFIKELI